MAKHRRMSERSVRTRTVIGGFAAGGALAALAPAGMAAAAVTDVNPDKPETQVNAETPGASVGRPDLNNPAPGLRAAQQFGDSIFNQTPGINKTLDDSPVGTGYHQVLGKRGDLAFNDRERQVRVHGRFRLERVVQRRAEHRPSRSVGERTSSPRMQLEGPTRQWSAGIRPPGVHLKISNGAQGRR